MSYPCKIVKQKPQQVWKPIIPFKAKNTGEKLIPKTIKQTKKKTTKKPTSNVNDYFGYPSQQAEKIVKRWVPKHVMEGQRGKKHVWIPECQDTNVFITHHSLKV